MCIHIRGRILPSYTIRGAYNSRANTTHLRSVAVRILYAGEYYSRAKSIRGNTVCMCGSINVDVYNQKLKTFVFLNWTLLVDTNWYNIYEKVCFRIYNQQISLTLRFPIYLN